MRTRLLANATAVLMAMLSAASSMAQGYVCAEGGGTGSGAWAEEMFRWMVIKGNNGPAVIVGAVDLDASDKPDSREALFTKVGASSVRSLVVTSANADAQETYDAIAGASIVFIRGGSQSRYVEMWKGTKTEKAIHAVFDKGGVIGGTSAGCAVLGEVTYDARNGSLRPEEAVRDAYHEDLTLTKGFLGLVPGVLFDTHFGERARLPRLALMLAHCREDLKVEPIGIGLDPRTALCVDPDGTAVVMGEGYATFLEITLGTRTVLTKGAPPVVTPLMMTLVPSGAEFNIKTRSFTSHRESVARTQWAGVTNPIPVAGDKLPKLELRWLAEHVGDRLLWVTSDARSEQLYCAVDAYKGARETMDLLHHHMWSPAKSRVLMLTAGVNASIEGTGVVFSEQPPQVATSAVVIDVGCVRESFVSTWSNDAIRRRGSVYRAKLHLLPPGWKLDFADGTPERTAGAEGKKAVPGEPAPAPAPATGPTSGP